MAGSATAPTMLALDAATGQTLWTFAAVRPSTPARRRRRCGLLGLGLCPLGIPGFTTNNKFYAFSVDGK
jgi:outer membrane protein assembly factor BamB